MVERARLESGAWETTRGFESLPLRSWFSSDDADPRHALAVLTTAGASCVQAGAGRARATASRTPSRVRGLERVVVAPMRLASFSTNSLGA